MLVVVERRKVDLEFPMEHQNERRNEQQPWPNDRSRTDWKYWIPRLKNVSSKKPAKTEGGTKTQDDRGRERQEEEEGGKKERRQEEKVTGDKGMGWRGIILTSLL